jgi:hypothetical protein
MKSDAMGLLRRASRFHAPSHASDWRAPLSSSEEDDGITAEERRAIIADIDQVASRTRIAGSAARSSPKPAKRGFVFPLVVNVLAIGFTAACLLALALAFRQRDQVTAELSSAVTTAEGKLIREIKRDSDSKLQEKDKAIAEIQRRLSSIDRQRGELAASIGQKISEREAELRAALKAELDAERAKLAGKGYSEADIQDRIKKLEAQKTAEFNRRLDEYRRSVEAERAAEEARLAQVRSEYQRDISGLNEERKRILDEAKRSEDRLRASLDARARELEGQGAAARESLARAQAELGRLTEQRAKSAAAEERIVGLYGAIRAALRERRFDSALASVSALDSFMADPSVASDPSLKARREADLFISEALGSLARIELERSSADVTRLLGQAELLASVRESSAAGARALRAGDAAAAAERYRAALAAVPEILAAHDYFMSAAREADAAEAARLKAALEDAERAWRAGSFAECSRRYAEALSALPIDEAQRAAMLARLARPDPASVAAAAKASDSAAARDAYASASRNLAAGKWPESIALFAGLVGAYPAAEQVPAALEGIGTARAGMESDYAARAAAYEKSIAELRAEAGAAATGLQSESATLGAAEKAQAEAERQLKAAQSEIARLQRQLEAAAAASAEAAARSGAVPPEAAAAAQAASADSLALAELRGRAKALQDEYASFLGAERAAAGAGGDFAVEEGRARLAAFLGGKEVAALFPELAGIVDARLGAYRQQLSLETLRTAADIAIQAASARTAKDKDAVLDVNAKHYSTDRTISDFIGVLRDLLK